MKIVSIVLYILGFLVLIGSFSAFQEQSTEEKIKKFSKLLATGVFLLVFAWLVWPSVSEPLKIESHDVEAYVMSEEFVKAKLKTPATANFPGGSLGRVRYLKDSVFVVNSFVDAQNLFGATVRMNYMAKLKYANGDKWELVELNLDDK